MNEPRIRAFTLIELLIVVAIIAILAAIALPNFLEAQTRARVSRAKADMRTMATALEAYAVDWNKYPFPSDEFGNSQTTDDPQTEWIDTRVPPALTTPVAYITQRLNELFPNRDITENPQYHFSTRDYARLTEGPDVGNAEFGGFLFAEVNRKLPGVLWFLLSHGPDHIHNEDDPALYDPTNGTVSDGDIIYGGPGMGFLN